MVTIRKDNDEQMTGSKSSHDLLNYSKYIYIYIIADNLKFSTQYKCPYMVKSNNKISEIEMEHDYI